MSITVITNSSSATQSLYGWKGTPQNPRQEAQAFRRLGGSGSEINLTGTQAPQSESSAVAFAADASSAATIQQYLEALENTYFSIALATGETFGSCLGTSVNIQKTRGRYAYAGVVYPWKVEVRLSYEVQP